MKPITPAAIELVRSSAPWFETRLVEACEHARRSAARPTLTVRLDDFQDDPLAVFACLWLAESYVAEVRFVP